MATKPKTVLTPSNAESPRDPTGATLPLPAGNSRRLLSIISIAATLALAGCASSNGPATTPIGSPAHGATAFAPRHRLARTRPRRGGLAIAVRSSNYGRILADRGNRTIYLFTRDRSAVSTCYGSCAAAWPPVLTKGPPKGTGGLRGPLDTTRRRDGTVQVTYGGHPLYYYVGDAQPGQILCQNAEEFGGIWLIVSPAGRPVR
jgi:predicted lipoprotein with Yx(FWY)xxD motif